MKQIPFRTPTPQSEVIKVIECKEDYTHLRGNAIHDDCKSDSFIFTNSFQYSSNQRFILAKNLKNRDKWFNIDYITTIESNYKRIFVVFATNNHNFSKYRINEYFISNNTNFYITTDDKDKMPFENFLFSTYSSEDLSELEEKMCEEYKNGTIIEDESVKYIRKYNCNTKKYE